MSRLAALLRTYRPPVVIGMVHCAPTLAAPNYTAPFEHCINAALNDARLLLNNGVNALMIENMRDAPYLLQRHVGPELTASMAVIASILRRELSPAIPLGIQILAGANKEAMAVAAAADLDFIRIEGYVFSHIGDEGFHEACAGQLMRYRQVLHVQQHVMMIADIKKKHSSHAVTSDVNIAETAQAAEFFGADGLIVTGKATGKAVDEEDLCSVRRVSNLPLFVGSGVTEESVEKITQQGADAIIVGSAFRENGHWCNPMSEARIQKFMDKVRQL